MVPVMSFVNIIQVLFFLLSVALSKPAPLPTAQDASTTTSASTPVSTICGDIIDYTNQGYSIFDAYSVYQCFLSVPFLDAVALRFIDYYNTTIQFQADLAYLKTPPTTYQQPAVDVLTGLEQIKQNISAGYYKNEYEFEATLQSLVYQMHDAHVDLYAGILSSFTFGSPYDIMSISVDGKQAPQVYIAADVVDSQTQPWTPSPIVSINGEDTVQYLERFAALNSVGTLEGHADWNQLMYSPVQDIEGSYNVFGWDATFYPGDELNFTFANQSTLETYWLGLYANGDPTGPLETGGDYYNFFVLGLVPASFDENAYNALTGDNGTTTDNITTTSNATSWYDVSPAYPEYADIVQPDLAVSGGGFLTGYFLNDTSTGVLSIPSFDEYGDIIGSFSNTTAAFIQGAQDAGLNRIVIDLQQNFGGTTLLAIDTFHQFFPNMDPYAASRRHSHPLENILGSAMTDFWSSLTPGTELYDDYYVALAANEWVVTDRINAATGRNFSSWEEFYGPVVHLGDTYSLSERYNLTSEVFDASAFDGWIPAGFDAASLATAPPPPPWEAKDIIILTDGICSSTCALFVELMTYQAGVRTVVVGGAPASGPMQAASGSRGARQYSADVLDDNLAFAGLVNETANTTLPQVRDPGMYTIYAGFNLRDEVRANDSTPLQFKYEAANCRIYYTFANAYNMSRLWQDAASAIWNDTSLCVEGSTGYATTGNTTAAKPPPDGSLTAVTFRGTDDATPVDFQVAYNGGLPDGYPGRDGNTFQTCTGSCPGSARCLPVSCSKGKVNFCMKPCDNPGASCPGGGTCWPTGAKVEVKVKVKGVSIPAKSKQPGVCVPPTQVCSLPSGGGSLNTAPRHYLENSVEFSL